MRSVSGIVGRLAAAATAALVCAGALAEPVSLGAKDSLETGAPGPVNEQTTAPLWGDARITGLSMWRGTTAATRTAAFIADPVGANAGTKLLLDSSASGSPEQFLFGARTELFTHQFPARRAALLATVAEPLRASAEVFVESIESRWTFEPTSITENMILDRIMLGGPCSLEFPFDCAEIGVASGAPTPVLLAMAYRACTICIPQFMPLSYLDRAPEGSSIGDYAQIPVGAWFRLDFEQGADAVVRTYIDFLDGAGPFLIRETASILTTTMLDTVTFNGSFHVQGSRMYVDEVHASGVLDICDGDADGDGDIDFADLNIVVSQFNAEGPGLGGDFDGDRLVNFADLNTLLARFGQGCD